MVERVRAMLISGDGWAPGTGSWEWSSRKPETVSGLAERTRGVVVNVRRATGAEARRPAREMRADVEDNIVYMF